MNTYFYNYYTQKSITLYSLLIIGVILLFYDKAMPIYWQLFGVIEVVGFFYFTHKFSKDWEQLDEKFTLKKLFTYALTIRIVYVIFSYYFYEYMTGSPFEFEAADAKGYHGEAIWMNELYAQGRFTKYITYIKGNYSDAGYPLYLGFIYFVVNKSILITRIIKALLGAYTCVLIYKAAKHNFNKNVARLAGVMAMLFPSFIYHCGLHVKETEMIFLIVLFIERASFFIQSRTFQLKDLLIALTLAFSLFFLRTVLGVTALFSLLTYLIFISNKQDGFLRKIIISFWLILAVGLFLGGGIRNEISRYWEDRDTNQSQSMKARSELKTGNKLAKYGTGAVFAPFMLIAPFPTIVDIPTQQNQMMLNGGFFVRNVLAFFVFVALVFLYKTRLYKKYLFILSFLLLYLAILALSKFAISERFHMPAYPLLLIFAAFGVTKMNQQKVKYFVPYLILIGLIILGWNWFKLAGRGQV